MRKKITIALALVCLFAITIAFFNTHNVSGLSVKPLELPGNGDANDFDTVNFKINSKVNFEQEANVYKFKDSKANLELVKKIAKQFNIDGKIVDTGDNFMIDTGIEVLTVEKNTSMWSYQKVSRQSSEDNLSISDDDKVIRVAKATLDKYNIKIDSFCSPIVTNKTETSASDNSEKITAKDIYFYKSFNGKPLLGTSRIIVTVGNNDEVCSISKYYREFNEKPYKVKLKNKEKLLSEIKSNKAMIKYEGKNSKLKNIDITSAELYYWEDGVNDLLQPVYMIKGLNPDNVSEEFSAYIPAIEDGQTIQ